MDVTWKLRPGVQWHDGHPHTSADVKFTADAIIKGDWKPESTDGFDRITSVDTPDSLTAVVHYKECTRHTRCSSSAARCPSICSRAATSTRPTTTTASPMGTGPYRVAEWKTGEYVLLERVPALLARRGVSQDQAHPLPLRHQHHDAHQSAEGGRSASRRARAVGQGARAEGRADTSASIRCSATATSM